MPTLPGSRPIRCEASGLRATYTFGIEGAPGARAALAVLHKEQEAVAAAEAAALAAGKRRRGHGLPGPWLGVHNDAAKVLTTAAKLREAEAMLLTTGYKRASSRMDSPCRPADLRPVQLFMSVMQFASSILEARICEERGMIMPLSPVFYVSPDIYNPMLHHESCARG